MRVLLVEDDPMFGRALVRGLNDQGIIVDWVHEGHDAQASIRNEEHALILLDIGLPGLSGFDVLKAARSERIATPFIIITARDLVDDRVAGLDSGADDYIVKPFDLDELLARMRAVLRRHGGQADTTLASAEISLNLATHAVSYRGREEVLPNREFALLEALMLRAGTILSRASLEDRLYGWGEEVESNAVDVLIHSVRKKFDRDIILNVRGAGWMVRKTQL